MVFGWTVMCYEAKFAIRLANTTPRYQVFHKGF